VRRAWSVRGTRTLRRGGVSPPACARFRISGAPLRAHALALHRIRDDRRRDFQPADVKEGKQAEFLVHQSFPWELVERIGVVSQGVAQRVANAMEGSAHRPRVEIRPDWYY
jgi:ssDNA thymidine ADP-ribosyltransferase, DarT